MKQKIIEFVDDAIDRQRRMVDGFCEQLARQRILSSLSLESCGRDSADKLAVSKDALYQLETLKDRILELR